MLEAGEQMDYGFIRDAERRLVVTTEGEGGVDRGFLRDGDGRLIVATEGEGSMDYGLVRDGDRRLLVVEGEVDHVDQGFPRDTKGRLVVTEGEGDHFDQGFLRDSDGRIVVTGLSKSDLPAEEPEITRAEATDVTATTATLKGGVNPHGSAVEGRFEWETDDGSIERNTDWQELGDGTDEVVFEATLTDLEPGTKYVFRAEWEYANGEHRGWSEDIGFTTGAA